MTNLRTFRELNVWQMGMDAAMRLFEATKRFPSDERFSLTDQIRRSSRSVPANISEAWRKRRYPAAFVSKLNDAEGEAAETQTHIEVALRCKYLTPEEARTLDIEYENILGKLVNMAAHPEDWVIRPAEQRHRLARHGDTESERRGDTETGRHGAEATPSPRPRVPASPPPPAASPRRPDPSPRLRVSPSPRLPIRS